MNRAQRRTKEYRKEVKEQVYQALDAIRLVDKLLQLPENKSYQNEMNTFRECFKNKQPLTEEQNNRVIEIHKILLGIPLEGVNHAN